MTAHVSRALITFKRIHYTALHNSQFPTLHSITTGNHKSTRMVLLLQKSLHASMGNKPTPSVNHCDSKRNTQYQELLVLLVVFTHFQKHALITSDDSSVCPGIKSFMFLKNFCSDEPVFVCLVRTASTYVRCDKCNHYRPSMRIYFKD